MNYKKITSLNVVFFGLAAAALVHFVLPFCAPMGKMVMACQKTQSAEFLLGVSTAIIGAVAFIVSFKKDVSRIVSVVGAVAGIFVAAIPTVIIGTCASVHMHCHAVAQPALVIFGVVQVLFFVANTAYILWRRKHEFKPH